MKKALFFCFLLALSAFAFEKGQNHRFHRMIKGFNYPHYRESDRDIVLNFQYDAYRSNNIPEEADIDELQKKSFYRDMNGELELDLDFISSNPVRRTDQNIVFRAGGSLNERFVIMTNEILGTFDTLAERMSEAEGICAYNLYHEKHFGFKRLNGLPFFGAYGHVTLRGTDTIKNYYLHHNNYSSPFRRSKEINQSVTLTGSVEPSVGVGNRKPVKPIYEAFLVERKLKKAGALRGDLSDSTMYSIAELIASLKACRLKHDKYEKFLMSGLQKILNKDSCVIDSALDAFTLFKAREGIISEHPLFYSGFSARIYEIIRADGGWNSKYATRDSTDDRGFEFNWDLIPMLEVMWTAPVFKRFFISLNLKKPIFDVSNDLSYSIYPQFGIDAYFLLLDRLTAEAGFTTGRYGKREFFINGELAFNLYIEDKMAVSFFVRENFVNDKRNANSTTKSLIESASVKLNYDF